MYRIITTDGVELGLVDGIRYIKKAANGTFVQTTADAATGVAYNGTPYNLFGHNEIADAATVIVCRVNIGDEISRLIANQDYIAMMSDIELETEEEITEEEITEEEITEEELTDEQEL